MTLSVCPLGLVPYGQALDIQRRLLARRQAGEIGNVLLLLEHPSVLTLGARANRANIYLPEDELARRGVPVVPVDRGGDVTYHGPGQLVGYPIVDLRDFGDGIRPFLHGLEDALVGLLREEFGLDAVRLQDRYTGVWIRDRKILAIGIAVHRWVTTHGFAFNVNVDLEPFGWINPCGLSKGVTSVLAETGRPADMDRIVRLTGRRIAAALGTEPADVSLSDLLGQAAATPATPGGPE